MVEEAGEVKVCAEFPRRQPVQLVAHGSPAEQVGPAAPHLASTGAAKGEAQPSVFEQPMHLVEQCRYFLNLVNDDLAAGIEPGRLDFLTQKLRVGDVPPELVGL